MDVVPQPTTPRVLRPDRAGTATMVGYRDVGVTLVTRALDCASVWLMEQDVRGSLSVTTWDREDGVVRPGRSAIPEVFDTLAGLPLLRPAIDRDGTIVLSVRAAEGRVTGWRLIGTGTYSWADLEAAARMVSVLADPAMLEPPGRRTSETVAVLTRREAEILALVGEGLTARAVARRCSISERTVQKHLEQAYRKLDCHDRLSAVLLARDCGLLGPYALDVSGGAARRKAG
jgi:DNA-binding CsgD family transcriptional regulator